MSSEELSGEDLGWVIYFTKSAAIESIIKKAVGRQRGVDNVGAQERKEVIGAFEKFSRECFDKLETMLPEGCRIASRQLCLGTGCIVGPNDACLKLKERVEADGFARMTRNSRTYVID